MMLNYDYSDHHSILEISKHRAIWRAVIMQALLDITNDSSRTENKIAKQQARLWILNKTEDFVLVCKMAEYDPEYVIKKTKHILRSENGGYTQQKYRPKNSFSFNINQQKLLTRSSKHN